MHARMCQRVHLLYHQRRFVTRNPSPLQCSLLTIDTASEKCQQEKRKTVNGEDILFAMTSLGFENYGEALKIYLARYREVSTVQLVMPTCIIIIPPVLTSNEAAVARGETQKPSAGGSGTGANSATSPYEGSNHNVIGNAMDQGVEGSTDFAYDNSTQGGY